MQDNIFMCENLHGWKPLKDCDETPPESRRWWWFGEDRRFLEASNPDEAEMGRRWKVTVTDRAEAKA